MKYKVLLHASVKNNPDLGLHASCYVLKPLAALAGSLFSLCISATTPTFILVDVTVKNKGHYFFYARDALFDLGTGCATKNTDWLINKNRTYTAYPVVRKNPDTSAETDSPNLMIGGISREAQTDILDRFPYLAGFGEISTDESRMLSQPTDTNELQEQINQFMDSNKIDKDNFNFLLAGIDSNRMSVPMESIEGQRDVMILRLSLSRLNDMELTKEEAEAVIKSLHSRFLLTITAPYNVILRIAGNDRFHDNYSRTVLTDIIAQFELAQRLEDSRRRRHFDTSTDIGSETSIIITALNLGAATYSPALYDGQFKHASHFLKILRTIQDSNLIPEQLNILIRSILVMHRLTGLISILFSGGSVQWAGNVKVTPLNSYVGVIMSDEEVRQLVSAERGHEVISDYVRRVVDTVFLQLNQEQQEMFRQFMNEVMRILLSRLRFISIEAQERITGGMAQAQDQDQEIVNNFVRLAPLFDDFLEKDQDPKSE